MLALIGNIDTTEVLIVLIGAVLVFGKRLPQVAAEAGAQLNKLRRSLDGAWKESGVDKEVREMQRSIESIRDAVPRDLSAASLARTAAAKFQQRVEEQQRLAQSEAELAAATQPAQVVDERGLVADARTHVADARTQVADATAPAAQPPPDVIPRDASLLAEPPAGAPGAPADPPRRP